MHIPDNYLSPATCAVLGAVMLPIWKNAVNKVKRELTPKKVPLLGISAAFSFLIMMFNVPLPGGTTGHAIGATLIAILLGPYSACISVTIALLIQALLFADGGILSFGVNCFNMAFIAPFAGYYIYKFLKNKVKSEKGIYFAIAAGSYAGINIAALFAGIEFGIQPLLFKDSLGHPIYCPYSLKTAIPAMTIPHLLVAGIIEAAVTVGVYSYIKKMSPEMIYDDNNSKVSKKPFYALIIFMIVLCPLGLLATGTAWGEWRADEIKALAGFIPKGIKNGINFNALMSGYKAHGTNKIVGYVLSALVGVLIIFIIFKLIFSLRMDEKNN